MTWPWGRHWRKQSGTLKVETERLINPWHWFRLWNLFNFQHAIEDSPSSAAAASGIGTGRRQICIEISADSCKKSFHCLHKVGSGHSNAKCSFSFVICHLPSSFHTGQVPTWEMGQINTRLIKIAKRYKKQFWYVDFPTGFAKQKIDTDWSQGTKASADQIPAMPPLAFAPHDVPQYQWELQAFVLQDTEKNIWFFY